MKKFRKLVAIEPVSLVPEAENELGQYAEEVVLYPDIPADDAEIIRRIGDADGVLVSYTSRISGELPLYPLYRNVLQPVFGRKRQCRYCLCQKLGHPGTGNPRLRRQGRGGIRSSSADWASSWIWASDVEKRAS